MQWRLQSEIRWRHLTIGETILVDNRLNAKPRWDKVAYRKLLRGENINEENWQTGTGKTVVNCCRGGVSVGLIKVEAWKGEEERLKHYIYYINTLTHTALAFVHYYFAINSITNLLSTYIHIWSYYYYYIINSYINSYKHFQSHIYRWYESLKESLFYLQILPNLNIGEYGWWNYRRCSLSYAKESCFLEAIRTPTPQVLMLLVNWSVITLFLEGWCNSS